MSYLRADRDVEAAEAMPHHLGCFEEYAEHLVEEAAARGVELDGAYDDLYGGMTIMARFHMEMVEGTHPCVCPTNDVAPGWYDDPQLKGHARYHNGDDWVGGPVAWENVLNLDDVPAG